MAPVKDLIDAIIDLESTVRSIERLTQLLSYLLQAERPSPGDVEHAQTVTGVLLDRALANVKAYEAVHKIHCAERRQ